MCRITVLSLLVAGAVARPHGRPQVDKSGMPSEAQLQATLKHLHDKAPVTHLRGEYWEIQRRLKSSKRQLGEHMKEEAKKSSILSHPDAQSVFVQEQAEQQEMDRLAGKHDPITGTEHSNPEDPELGVLREPDLEGPGLIEESMEKYNEGEDAQDEFNEVNAENAGVEREVVPVKNVDGEGWFVDDKAEYHTAIDEAVAAHRHDVVRLGRASMSISAMQAKKKQEKKDEDKEDSNEATELLHEDGFEGY